MNACSTNNVPSYGHQLGALNDVVPVCLLISPYPPITEPFALYQILVPWAPKTPSFITRRTAICVVVVEKMFNYLTSLTVSRLANLHPCVVQIKVVSLSSKKDFPAYTCMQPKMPGNGPQRLMRYYYDGSSDQCRPFMFRGGNMVNTNVFTTKADCEVYCRSGVVLTTSINDINDLRLPYWFGRKEPH